MKPGTYVFVVKNDKGWVGEVWNVWEAAPAITLHDWACVVDWDDSEDPSEWIFGQLSFPRITIMAPDYLLELSVEQWKRLNFDGEE